MCILNRKPGIFCFLSNTLQYSSNRISLLFIYLFIFLHWTKFHKFQLPVLIIISCPRIKRIVVVVVVGIVLNIEPRNNNEQGRGKKHQTATLHHKKNRRLDTGAKKFTSAFNHRLVWWQTLYMRAYDDLKGNYFKGLFRKETGFLITTFK